MTLGEGATTFRDKITEEIEKGSRKIVPDLCGVRSIHSAGIGELVSAFTNVTNKGGELALVGLTERAESLLRITKLYTAFKVFGTQEEAVLYFSAPAASSAPEFKPSGMD